MSIREILKYPDPFLKTKASPVSEVDDEIRSLIDDMFQTMYFDKGIGLAATQIGVDKRVLVLDIPAEREEGVEGVEGEERFPGYKYALVNPEITLSEGEFKFEEGCLSVPGVNAFVKRAFHIKLTALDRDGNPLEIEAEDILSVVLQHEIDHLDGILFIDRLSRLKRDIVKRRYRKLQEQDEEAI
jgi:peptide deformylase